MENLGNKYEELIEQTAMQLFFRDMVDGEISQHWCNIWEIEEEPEKEEKIRNVYRNKAKKYLEFKYYLKFT